MKANNEFHAHLDQCRQCEEHPFELCPIGAALLQNAGREALGGFMCGKLPTAEEVRAAALGVTLEEK